MKWDAEFRIAADREFVDYVKWLSKEVYGFSSMSDYCRMAINRQVQRDKKEMGLTDGKETQRE